MLPVGDTGFEGVAPRWAVGRTGAGSLEGVEELGGSLNDVESGDRLPFGGQLFAGLRLQLQPLAVDGVGLCFRAPARRSPERGRWSTLARPTRTCFGEADGAAGGGVGGDLQQGIGRPVGMASRGRGPRGQAR